MCNPSAIETTQYNCKPQEGSGSVNTVAVIIISPDFIPFFLCVTHCLRVAGRKPTISMASWSLSKSCFRSSPSTVKQSCKRAAPRSSQHPQPPIRRASLDAKKGSWQVTVKSDGCLNVLNVYTVLGKDAQNSFKVYFLQEVAASVQNEWLELK